MTRSIRTAVLALLGFAVLLVGSSAAAEVKEGAASARKLNVAVVTGGHAFIERDFLKLFQGYDDITYKHVPEKVGGELFEDITDWPYDVIVLYNFNRQITPRQQKNFLELLDKGVGLAYVPAAAAKPGTAIEIVIRDKAVPAAVVRPPFYKDGSIRH